MKKLALIFMSTIAICSVAIADGDFLLARYYSYQQSPCALGYRHVFRVSVYRHWYSDSRPTYVYAVNEDLGCERGSS